jgi:MFS family permease
MIGSFMSLFVGYLSDRFGRRRVCVCACTLLFLVQLINSLMQQPELMHRVVKLSAMAQFGVYAASRFFVGILTNALFCIAYVLLLELTTSKHHTLISNVNMMWFIVGELAILLVGYLARDWRLILWFITGWSLVSVVLVFFCLPESPVYLLEMGRYERAGKLVSLISKSNKTTSKKKKNDELADLNNNNNNNNEMKEMDKFISLNNTNDRSRVSMLMSQLVSDYEKKKKRNTINVNKQESADELKQSPLLGQNDENTTNTSTSRNKTDLNVLRYVLSSKRNVLNFLFLSYVWFDLSLIYYGISLGNIDKRSS